METRLVWKIFVVSYIFLFLACPGCYPARERENIPSSGGVRTLDEADGKSGIGTRPGNGVYEGVNEVPEWVRKIIAKEKAGRVANPPASISRCTYGNRTVYYRPPRCCDIPGVLWDENGKFVCSPDGGMTGRGDGKCPDFHAAKKECVIIWRDSRSLR